VLEHPLDGVIVLMGGVVVLGRPELRAERKGKRGAAVMGALYKRRDGEWGTGHEWHHTAARCGGVGLA
jgi:hypothetical protein